MANKTLKEHHQETMVCPECGANIERTEFSDGSVLIRRDCNCEAKKELK